MPLTIHTEAPPLRQDEDGALRIGQSRVLLELVIYAFQDGATPEAIVQRYPPLDVADVYAVVSYYLKHCVEINLYLAEREKRAEEVSNRIQSQQSDLAKLRMRLQRTK